MTSTAPTIEQSYAPRLENLRQVAAPFGKGQWQTASMSVFPESFVQEMSAFCLSEAGAKGTGFGVAVRVRDQLGDAYLRVDYSAEGHPVRTSVTLPPALEAKRDEMKIPRNEHEMHVLGDLIISALKSAGPEIRLPALPISNNRQVVVQA